MFCARKYEHASRCLERHYLTFKAQQIVGFPRSAEEEPSAFAMHGAGYPHEANAIQAYFGCQSAPACSRGEPRRSARTKYYALPYPDLLLSMSVVTSKSSLMTSLDYYLRSDPLRRRLRRREGERPDGPFRFSSVFVRQINAIYKKNPAPYALNADLAWCDLPAFAFGKARWIGAGRTS